MDTWSGQHRRLGVSSRSHPSCSGTGKSLKSIVSYMITCKIGEKCTVFEIYLNPCVERIFVVRFGVRVWAVEGTSK